MNTYKPLPSDDFESGTSEPQVVSLSLPIPNNLSCMSKLLNTAVNLSICVVAVCALLNAWIIYSTLSYGHMAEITLRTRYDLKQLAWRSSYIDFDRLYKSPPKAASSAMYGSVVNHAQSTAIVSAVQPNQVLPPPQEEYHLFFDGNSTVNSRRLVATSDISTISQYRILDWGMENCTISVTLPPSSDMFTKLHVLSTPAYVNVWVLVGAEELDFGVMTYATKPQRRFLLGTLSVAAGETVTSPSFRCLTASYLAIEIESAGPQHVLNVTHIGYSPFGLYIRQSQTV
ncbi:hypothetical protein BC629DRAFT_1591291 [Irpex lacteus]|nr:hypothetical protein BC629DRAFT_1591291 [Irpex lacteus]